MSRSDVVQLNHRRPIKTALIIFSHLKKGCGLSQLTKKTLRAMTMGRGFEVTTFSFQNDFIVLLFLGKKMKKKLKNFSRDF
jgi:hypothetical protein